MWGAKGQLLAAWAWRFGAGISTNNAAELGALEAGLKLLTEMNLPKKCFG